MSDTLSFGFNDLFWLTLLVLFSVTLLGGLVRRFRKDRCLKLLHDFHVTVIHGNGRPLWGDLEASSRGIEILYDAPFVNARGLIKTSHLVSAAELDTCLALCRTVHALTADEQRARAAQIERTFAPKLAPRSLRKLRNFVDMLSDAVGKSVGVVVASLGGRLGSAMASRKDAVDDLGKTLAGVVNFAYEPLLEKHIGKHVIVECKTAPGAAVPTTEFAGYLVEYTEHFLAVFNRDQTPRRQVEIDAVAGSYDGFEITTESDNVTFVCTGFDALVLRNVTIGASLLDLDITLLPGCSFSLRTEGSATPRARLELTHQIDLVCPRGNARIRFGSEPHPEAANRHGLAPDEEQAEEIPADAQAAATER